MPTDHPLPQRDVQKERRARRGRNIALGLAVGGLCLLFYAVTIVKFGPAVLVRPL